jgi:uncharacterized membrane-anchored protein
VRGVIAPGPDRAGRRGRLVLIAAITGVLGAAAVVYGLVSSLVASSVVGVLLLLVALYCLVVLRGLQRRGPG